MIAALLELGLGFLTLACSGLVTALAVRPLPDLAGEKGEWERLGLLVLGLGWGFGFIPALAYFGFYFTFGILVGWDTIGAASALSVLIALAWWRVRPRPANAGPFFPHAIPAMLKRHGAALFLSLVVGLVWVLKYERSLSIDNACIDAMALRAAFPDPEFLGELGGFARLGNTAVIAGFLGLFEGLGFRWLHGVIGLLLALGGYLSGWSAGGRRAWGFLAMALLALNPYVLKIPLHSENLLALAFLATIFPWFLKGRPPWALVALLASLVLGMRHILVLAVPAMVWAAWFRTRSPRQVILFLAALLVGTLPYHVNHLLEFGSIFRFESFAEVPAVIHGVGPFTFQWEGLMNWPFHDTVIRTPGNPYPLFVMWPLWLIDHFGLVLSAAALWGLWTIHGRNPRASLFLVGFFVPTFGALALQENWDDTNKMNVVVILFTPLVAWMVAGVKDLVSRPRVAIPAVIVGALLLYGAATLAGRIDAPPDPRYLERHPDPSMDMPEWISHARAEALDLAPWPDFGRLDEFGGFLPGTVLSRLLDDLRDHDVKALLEDRERHHDRLFDPGNPVDLEIDLSRPPWGKVAPVRTASMGPVIDLTSGNGPILMGPVNLPWTDHPATILTTPPGSPATALLVAFGDRGLSPCLVDPGEARGIGLDNDALNRRFLGRDGDGPFPLSRSTVSSPVIRIRVPTGTFSLFVSLNCHVDRYLTWEGTVGTGEAVLHRSLWYHN